MAKDNQKRKGLSNRIILHKKAIIIINKRLIIINDLSNIYIRSPNNTKARKQLAKFKIDNSWE